MVLPFVLFIPELAIYGVQTNKANNLAAAVAKEAEVQGGITPEVLAFYDKKLNDYGLDPDILKLTYSSTGQLQQKQKFALEVNGYFQSKTFNLLGTGVGNFKMPIYAAECGASEVWVR